MAFWTDPSGGNLDTAGGARQGELSTGGTTEEMTILDVDGSTVAITAQAPTPAFEAWLHVTIGPMVDSAHFGDWIAGPGLGPVDQPGRVDDLEVAAGDPVQLVQTSSSSACRGAGDVPGRAVVGEDHPVALEGLGDDPRLGEKSTCRRWP